MEVFYLNSLYIAVFILCIFIATVLYICCKLIRQDSRIEALYQPQVIRPPRSVAKLRKPRNRNITSKGTQTLNVSSVYAALQKSNISSQNPVFEASTISSIEEEVKIEIVEPFTNPPDFYRNPSTSYETICDIHRQSAYTCVHHWFSEDILDGCRK